jgi:hypothetical protein
MSLADEQPHPAARLDVRGREVDRDGPDEVLSQLARCCARLSTTRAYVSSWQ